MTSPRSVRRAVERRRRFGLAVGVAVVVLAAAFAIVATGLSGGAGDDHPAGSAPSPSDTAPGVTRRPTTTTPPTTAATPGTTTPTSTTQPLSPLPVDRTYAVGTRALTFVDSSRPTSPNGDFAGASTRTLPTQFWYPAEGDAGGEPHPDGSPDRAHGPYPLVVFAHGYNVTPDFYAPLLERWAAAGYVVVAPTFPILSGIPGGASHVDYDKTFGDTSFVIGQVLAIGAGEPLGGLVDPARIAVTGHSDGEAVAFGVGFFTCCRDPRVRSVIAMAGDLSNANNPSVRDSGTPILHIMETGDEYDPYPHSIEWDRENLTPPRWMLTLQSTHVPPYTQPGDPAFELVNKVTIA
ncbi:MAG: alpha/beta hydrolase family protein, partial [Acidimicrobiia bacterium]